MKDTDASAGSVLRVGIDARLTSGLSGGVEQVVIGLAHGLSQLEAESEEYIFLTTAKGDDWLRPYLGGHCRPLMSADRIHEPSWAAGLKRRSPWLARIARNAPAMPGLRRPGPHRSEGTIESAGIEVMHFTIQDAFLTDLPSIYQPHDLQHLHLPGFFTPREREYRERTYRLHCERAEAVVVMTRWGREDVMNHYGLPSEKVYIIPWAPVLDAYGDPSQGSIEEVSSRHQLPKRFAFYPATSYPHKNHLTLLESIAILRDRGTRIPLVCTGGVTDFHSHIRDGIEKLRLEDQVHFLGYLPPLDVHVLYRRAHCLIFPTLFEGWGMPIFEAFRSRLPVACSDIPVVNELARDAAISFDPQHPEAIAEALMTVWEDDEIRRTLVDKASRRIEEFSWRTTGAKFRVLYRSVAGRPLTAKDRHLLSTLST